MYRGEIQNDSIGGSLHRSLAFSPSNSGGGGNDRYESRNLSVGAPLIGAGIGRCEEDEYNCCGLYGRGDEDDPCWDGYEMIGTKMKKGREVPNCVPVGEGKPFTKKQLTKIILDKNKVIADLEENAYEGGAAPKVEPKAPSGFAAGAEALKPVREAIQNGVGDLLYGKTDDPKKQRKGLLGISEEGKEESKKKVMKNIVVPLTKAAMEVKDGIVDIWDSAFNQDALAVRNKEKERKRKLKVEQDIGVFRDKEGNVAKKPKGWTETGNAYMASLPYVLIPNPLKAEGLRPSDRELSLAGIKLWSSGNTWQSGNQGKTLKELHNDDKIWVPEGEAKEIYKQLSEFRQNHRDANTRQSGLEELMSVKQYKDFSKLDKSKLSGSELRDYNVAATFIKQANLRNAERKVEKDIKEEEAKANPDKARLAKMKEAQARVKKTQKDDAAATAKAAAEAARLAEEKYRADMARDAAERQALDAKEQADATAAFKALSPAERSAQIDEYRKDLQEQGFSEEAIEDMVSQIGEQGVMAVGGAGSDDEDDDDEDSDDEEEEEVKVIEVKMSKVSRYFVDAPTRNEKGELVGLPLGTFKRAIESIMGIGNRRVYDPESGDMIGYLKDPLWKKVAMKVYNSEKEWRDANLKKLGFAMDEDTDGDSVASESSRGGGAKPEPDDDELVGEGAIEFTLQKAGKSLFNPTGNMTMAGKQTFTPDYDAYGATVAGGRLNAFNLSRSMYNQQEAIDLPDFDLIEDNTSLRFYLKDDEDVIMVGIRGTDVKSWTELYTWAVIGANQDFRMTTRFQDDLQKLLVFQKEYPMTQYYYVGVGSSLAGSIADRFLDMGLLDEAITYNPSIEKKYVLDGDIHNHRVYLDTDPLFMLMGQYSPNTEIRVNASKTNFYNPSKEKDYLIKSHSIFPVYNPAFEGGGMEGSGKTYTLEEWKAIFDAKLEEKRKAIEAREAKKKQTAKAKRERAKARRDEREKPKEPEPEPELEVTQFTIEGQIILVEDDDGEKRFLDRRVFNDDEEEIGTIGSLTPEKLRKLVVERVQRAEKRGEFAKEVVFDEPPPLEAPFRTYRVQKATPPKGEPKKRKPRFKVVAPASARVELREELVAEQPRTEQGKFAEQAETAVVAVSQAPQRVEVEKKLWGDVYKVITDAFYEQRDRDEEELNSMFRICISVLKCIKDAIEVDCFGKWTVNVESVRNPQDFERVIGYNVKTDLTHDKTQKLSISDTSESVREKKQFSLFRVYNFSLTDRDNLRMSEIENPNQLILYDTKEAEGSRKSVVMKMKVLEIIQQFFPLMGLPELKLVKGKGVARKWEMDWKELPLVKSAKGKAKEELPAKLKSEYVPRLEQFIVETRKKLSEIIKRVRRDYELDAYDE